MARQTPGAVGSRALDLDGRFHFDNVPPGNYRVRVMIWSAARIRLWKNSASSTIQFAPETGPALAASGQAHRRNHLALALQHPVPKKAVRDFHAEAQRHSKRARNIQSQRRNSKKPFASIPTSAKLTSTSACNIRAPAAIPKRSRNSKSPQARPSRDGGLFESGVDSSGAPSLFRKPRLPRGSALALDPKNKAQASTSAAHFAARKLAGDRVRQLLKYRVQLASFPGRSRPVFSRS